ncbi:MAG: RNA polymerase sigma-70 factor [Bacteroidota bacterium]|nr:RNA polymerase sigma-70 factor [Bacteroidota bacterium]
MPLHIELKYTNVEYAQAFHDGEEKGFDFFYRKLFPSLYFFANRLVNDKCEAEDIVSNAFIKIWKRHTQFNDASSIRSYLYQIVRNDCYKFHQQQGRVQEVHKQVKYLTMVNVDDNREEDIIRAEFYGELYNAINSLPSECRRIFRMLYIQGKTVKEISQELKLSPSTVKTQKARGLAVLRKKLINLTLILSPIIFNILSL